jgi:hypothetical protein
MVQLIVIAAAKGEVTIEISNGSDTNFPARFAHLLCLSVL